MSALILDGKKLATLVEADLAKRVANIKERTQRTPILATILVGDDPSSATYVKMKGNACRRVGMDSISVTLPSTTTTETLLAEIAALNANPNVHGILLQHPVPHQIDERACFDAISLAKDVDGVTCLGFGRMSMGEEAYGSATPQGIMALLQHYQIPLEGKHAVVVGAVGKPQFIKSEWIKDGAVVVDAGYHAGGVGDIELAGVIERASAYTPVPGGVGPMTIATLMTQTVMAAEK